MRWRYVQDGVCRFSNPVARGHSSQVRRSVRSAGSASPRQSHNIIPGRGYRACAPTRGSKSFRHTLQGWRPDTRFTLLRFWRLPDDVSRFARRLTDPGSNDVSGTDLLGHLDALFSRPDLCTRSRTTSNDRLTAGLCLRVARLIAARAPIMPQTYWMTT